LLYTLGRPDGTERIVKSRADGSGAAVVSPPCSALCLGDANPVYSPDGRWIAFERAFGPVVHENPARVAIFTMHANGSHLMQLTQKGAAASTVDGQPQWSPDGARIAFVRTNTTARPKNRGVIEIMDLTGSNIRRLTSFRIDATDPRWSPNSKRLLFSTYARPVHAKSANLFTMDADGKDRVALTNYTGGTLQAFADGWSPSGAQVLFHRMAFSGSSTEVGGFYILDLSPKHIFDFSPKHIRRLTHVRLHYDARADWGRRPG
jgi:Tol biopolymer transport system component